MSNSSEISEIERFSGRKSGKAPEKTNFAQTCNLLSQFLKERGTLGDLNLGIIGKLEAKGRPETFRSSSTTTTTMNLLPNMEKSGNMKSMDIFPQFAGFGSSDSIDDAINKANFRKPAMSTEPETAQMTIFYAGKVLVFNDFPADKAKEVMLLASNGSSHNSSGFVSTSGMDTVASGSNVVDLTAGTNGTQERLQPKPQPIGSDLPIARRGSLHRFLEKRKDRVAARGPYQVNNPSPAPPKPEQRLERNSGLDLEVQSSKQLELKL